MENIEIPNNEHEDSPERFPSREDVLAFIETMLGQLVSDGTITDVEHKVLTEKSDERGLKRYEIEVANGTCIEYQRNERGKCTVDVITQDNDGMPFGVHSATYNALEGTWKQV